MTRYKTCVTAATLVLAAAGAASAATAQRLGMAPATSPAEASTQPGAEPVTIAADYRAAVKKALPAPWEVGAGSALGTILLRDKTRPGRFHALLCVHAPGVTEHPGGGWGKGKTFRSILKAANGEVFLWAEPGDWKTMEADLAKAVVGEPLRVEEFTVEFTDARGNPQEAVVFPNWHNLHGFGHTQESFEKACRAALTARPVEDVRKVWVETSTHRDMLLTDMGQVNLRPGRPWPHPEVPLDRAVAGAAAVLRAVAVSQADVYRRSASHFSTVSGKGDDAIHGGGTVHFASCRQRFRVVEALLGDRVPEQRVVEYGFVEKSECFPGPSAERALPEVAAAILMLDEKGQLLKAVPDTEESRRRVRAALVPRATRPATQPASRPAGAG